MVIREARGRVRASHCASTVEGSVYTGVFSPVEIEQLYTSFFPLSFLCYSLAEFLFRDILTVSLFFHLGYEPGDNYGIILSTVMSSKYESRRIFHRGIRMLWLCFLLIYYSLVVGLSG